MPIERPGGFDAQEAYQWDMAMKGLPEPPVLSNPTTTEDYQGFLKWQKEMQRRRVRFSNWRRQHAARLAAKHVSEQ